MSALPFRPETWTIPQLNEWLNDVIQEVLGGEIWIEGEISNLQRSTRGHVYFTLVEGQSTPFLDSTSSYATAGFGRRQMGPHTLAVTLFDRQRQLVNQQLRAAGGAVRMSDGVRVRIRGTVELYGVRSQVQLRMSGIDPVFTLGTLEADRELLLASLRAEGLLDRNAQQIVPFLPVRVAIVTSIGSAAHADVMEAFTNARLAFDLTVVDTRVQGTDAHISIAAALERAQELDVDLVALVRGGGARTDLATFDHGDVARAVATSRLPIWVGLGHETDRTVVDEVAHRSLKTPTACAAAIVDRANDDHASFDIVWEAIGDRAVDFLERRRARIDRTARRFSAASSSMLSTASARLDRAATSMPRSANERVRNGHAAIADAERRIRLAPRHFAVQDRRLESLNATLRAYDPHTTLARGFSITRSANGALARPEDLSEGDTLITTLAHGTVTSTVLNVDARDEHSDTNNATQPHGTTD